MNKSLGAPAGRNLGHDKMSEKMTVESWLVHPLSTVSQQHKNPKQTFTLLDKLFQHYIILNPEINLLYVVNVHFKD